MYYKLTRRYFFLFIFALSSCTESLKSISERELNIGVISYEQGEQTLKRFTALQNYLGDKTGAIVQVEPVYNETLALERIKRHQWSLVFASPGLAALAIARYQYIALFPLQAGEKSHSLLVVRQDSSFTKLQDLQNQIVALSQPGSATGYYLPLYNLYGLTLAKIEFAPTPKTLLQWIAQGKVAAGGISHEELNLYSSQFSSTQFRILFTDPHPIPPGAVLITSTIERDRQHIISNYLQQAPANIIQQVGYSPKEQVPDYKYMTTVVERVTSITSNLSSEPVRVF